MNPLGEDLFDLSDLAGFPVFMNDAGLLSFGDGAVQVQPDVRKLEDASQVLLYPGETGPEILYWMYRGAGLVKDQKAISDASLRFDLTVLAPGTIGSEYVKTVGHYHPKVPGQPWSYPEVYQVLHGKAHFLLQRGGDVTGQLEDFAVADFDAGDILVIPPFYGHVTVNPSDGYMVMANWICKDFSSSYDPIKLRKGVAYYDVEYKGQSMFMPNESYESHPKPRLLKPVDYPGLGLTRGHSMYAAWQSGANLGFLAKPSLQEGLWQEMGLTPGGF